MSRARERGEPERSQLDQQDQLVAADHAVIDLAAEVQQAFETTEGGADGEDVLGSLGSEAADRGERADGANRAPAFLLGLQERRARIIHLEPVAARVHTWRKEQHAEASSLFDRRAKPVLRRATVVQHFGKEGRGGPRVHLQASLAKHVLRGRQRVAVNVQIADVVQEQVDQRVALIDRPLMPRAGLADGALHDVPTGPPATA
jgi:hypothetical protein